MLVCQLETKMKILFCLKKAAIEQEHNSKMSTTFFCHIIFQCGWTSNYVLITVKQYYVLIIIFFPSTNRSISKSFICVELFLQEKGKFLKVAISPSSQRKTNLTAERAVCLCMMEGCGAETSGCWWVNCLACSHIQQ